MIQKYSQNSQLQTMNVQRPGSMERHLNSIIEYKLHKEARELSQCFFTPNISRASQGSARSHRNFQKWYDDQLKHQLKSQKIKEDLNTRQEAEQQKLMKRQRSISAERKKLFEKLHCRYKKLRSGRRSPQPAQFSFAPLLNEHSSQLAKKRATTPIQLR